MEGVTCRPSQVPGGGRGVFATRPFATGDVIFSERPLAAMQSLQNAQQVLVCRRCLTFLAGLRTQLRLLGQGRLALLESAMSGSFSEDEATVEEESRAQARYTESIHPCTKGCGEVYCSKECMNLHWEQCHRLVCVGHVADHEAHAHPLVRLKALAAVSNEIIVMVLDILAAATLRYSSCGDAAEAVAPYSEFVQRPWWDVAVSSEGGDPEEFKAKLVGLCSEVCSLWKEANSGQVPTGLEPVWSAQYIGELIGLFEQNQLGIRRESPLVSWFHELGEASGGDKEKSKSTKCSESYQDSLLPLLAPLLMEDDDEEEDEAPGGGRHAPHKQPALAPHELAGEFELDSLFPDLDGTAIFTYICAMNHSCSPSCEIVYTGGTDGKPLMASVVALESICVGQELFFSYINSTLPYRDRKRALQDYGFVCRCRKCAEESAT